MQSSHAHRPRRRVESTACRPVDATLLIAPESAVLAVVVGDPQVCDESAPIEWEESVMSERHGEFLQYSTYFSTTSAAARILRAEVSQLEDCASFVYQQTALVAADEADALMARQRMVLIRVLRPVEV